MPEEESKAVIGCVLCGGKSRRMGSLDKALLQLNDTPLLQHVIQRLKHQVERTILSVNEPSELHMSFDLPMVADQLQGHLGPLAGIHAALNWAIQEAPEAKGVVTVAVDTPFFPTDLVRRLTSVRTVSLCHPRICASNGREHFAFGHWPIEMAEPLKDYLLEGGRSIRGFFENYPPDIIAFDGIDAVDPFFNINTPEDLPRATQYMDSQQIQT